VRCKKSADVRERTTPGTDGFREARNMILHLRKYAEELLRARTITLNSTDSFDPVVFGCGNET